MAELLFPKRQRCQRCSKGLGLRAQDAVLLGRYCSPRCAGVTVPTTNVEAAPRECRTQRDGAWTWKRRYRSTSEIPERLREDPSTSWYWCQHCSHLHVGRTLVETKRAENRGLRSRADVADLLVKARGGATHRQVAEVAAVRPIRIKEWEDKSFDAPSMSVLFALLKTYRVDLAAVFEVKRGG